MQNREVITGLRMIRYRTFGYMDPVTQPWPDREALRAIKLRVEGRAVDQIAKEPPGLAGCFYATWEVL